LRRVFGEFNNDAPGTEVDHGRLNPVLFEMRVEVADPAEEVLDVLFSFFQVQEVELLESCADAT